MGRMEWSGQGKWDNCNSIINKYIFKKIKNKMSSSHCLSLLTSVSVGKSNAYKESHHVQMQMSRKSATG